MLKYALWYAKQGLRILPLNGKIPLTDHGVHNASNDKYIVTGWFSHKRNIGIATGKASDIVVLDIDGEKGIESIREISKDYDREWLDTPVVKTANGYHVYFKYVEGLRNKVAFKPGLDFRADGGYVVAPPSVHETGIKYRWLKRIDEYDLAQVPAFILSACEKQSGTKVDWSKVPVYANVGERNSRIATIAGALLGKRLDSTLCYNLVCAYNNTFIKPPLEQIEVDRTFDSIYMIEERKRNGCS